MLCEIKVCCMTLTPEKSLCIEIKKFESMKLSMSTINMNSTICIASIEKQIFI